MSNSRETREISQFGIRTNNERKNLSFLKTNFQLAVSPKNDPVIQRDLSLEHS